MAVSGCNSGTEPEGKIDQSSRNVNPEQTLTDTATTRAAVEPDMFPSDCGVGGVVRRVVESSVSRAS